MSSTSDTTPFTSFPIHSYRMYDDFTIQPEWLSAISTLPPRYKDFYALIAKEAGEKGHCEFTRDQLANKLNITASRIDDYIEISRTQKFMEITRTGRGNRYAILYHPEMGIGKELAIRRRVSLPKPLSTPKRSGKNSRSDAKKTPDQMPKKFQIETCYIYDHENPKESEESKHAGELADLSSDRDRRSDPITNNTTPTTGLKSIHDLAPSYTDAEAAETLRAYQEMLTGSNSETVANSEIFPNNSPTSLTVSETTTLAHNSESDDKVQIKHTIQNVETSTTENTSVSKSTAAKQTLHHSHERSSKLGIKTVSPKTTPTINSCDNKYLISKTGVNPSATYYQPALSKYPLQVCIEFARYEQAVNHTIIDPVRVGRARHKDGRDDYLIELWINGQYNPMDADKLRTSRPVNQAQLDLMVGGNFSVNSEPSVANQNEKTELDKRELAYLQDLEIRRINAFDSLSEVERAFLIDEKIYELKNSANGKLFKWMTQEQLLERAICAIQNDLVVR